jgi:hypothetical protein
MNVNGSTPVVYIAPQALAPLVPSTEPIAMLLAARPDLNEATAQQAVAAQQPTAPVIGTTGTSGTTGADDDPGGHIDVYA